MGITGSCAGEEAANDNAVARGLSAMVECFKFVAYTCVMLDIFMILSIFSKLYKAFQSDILDYDKFAVLLALSRHSLTAMVNPEADGMPHLKPRSTTS